MNSSIQTVPANVSKSVAASALEQAAVLKSILESQKGHRVDVDITWSPSGLIGGFLTTNIKDEPSAATVLKQTFSPTSSASPNSKNNTAVSSGGATKHENKENLKSSTLNQKSATGKIEKKKRSESTAFSDWLDTSSAKKSKKSHHNTNSNKERRSSTPPSSNEDEMSVKLKIKLV